MSFLLTSVGLEDGVNNLLIEIRLAAAELGGPEAGVYFVPHGQYTAQAMLNLGPTVVDANYPIDGTHTAPFLADIVSSDCLSPHFI